MKAIWPGEPGGYVPTAWQSLMREAQIKANAQAMCKKQTYYTQLRDEQLDAKLKGRKKK